MVGFASGEIPQIKANYLLVKNIEVSGLQWSDYRDRNPQRVMDVQNELHALFSAGKITARVALKLPFENAAFALERVDGRGVSGRVVLGFD